MVTAGRAAGSVFGAGEAYAAGLHGAIAFSSEHSSYGISVDAPSREEAIDEAWYGLGGITDRVVLVDWSEVSGPRSVSGAAGRHVASGGATALAH